MDLRATSRDNEDLVEGGSALAGRLVGGQLDKSDRLVQAPKLMGNDGIAAISVLGVDRIEDISISNHSSRLLVKIVWKFLREHVRSALCHWYHFRCRICPVGHQERRLEV